MTERAARKSWQTRRASRPARPDRLVFVHNLREARLDLGLTYQAIHERTGISKGFISTIERGRVSVGIDIASELAEAVGKPLWELLKP